MKITPENHFEVGYCTLDLSSEVLTVQYKVKPITRYVVTRYEDGRYGGSVEEIGAGAECGNYDSAYEIAVAMALREEEKAEEKEGEACFPEGSNGDHLTKKIKRLTLLLNQLKGLGIRDVENRLYQEIENIKAELGISNSALSGK